MIAVQHTSYGFRIIHQDVVEDHEHKRSYERIMRKEKVNGVLQDVKERVIHKAFKCLHCGQWWLTSTTAPIEMEREQYELHYKEDRDVSCEK